MVYTHSDMGCTETCSPFYLGQHTLAKGLFLSEQIREPP